MKSGAGFPVYGMQTGQGFFGAIGRLLVPALKTAVRVAAPVAKRLAKTAARDLVTAGVTTGLEALEVRTRHFKRVKYDTYDFIYFTINFYK